MTEAYTLTMVSGLSSLDYRGQFTEGRGETGRIRQVFLVLQESKCLLGVNIRFWPHAHWMFFDIFTVAVFGCRCFCYSH